MKNPSGIEAGVYDDRYYSEAVENENAGFAHPGLADIQHRSSTCCRILDCGCGEGSKLRKMGGAGSELFGVEWSEVGVRRAAERPGIKVIQGDISSMPFPDNYFPFVYSAYVFEHVVEPMSILREMIRVTEVGGHIAILCPNFGSPFFRSPCSKGNPWWRGLKIVARDLTLSLTAKSELRWQKVTPLAKTGDWVSDWDTTIEPALIPLRYHLRSYPGVKVVDMQSFWSGVVPSVASSGMSRAKYIIKRFIAAGPVARFYYMRYWGPDLYMVVKKVV